ncbi:MAG: uracil-DNA glycosylase, partial [Chloroflexota bacterium]
EDPEFDLPGAAAMRRSNLWNYLESFETPPTMLVVSEAPGYRGGRFSGIPLVSERMLVTGPTDGITGRPTSLGVPYAEATATIFRRVTAAVALSPFIWNTVPFHPHHPGRPLTNRTPTRAEISTFAPLLGDVLRMVQPRLVIALGRQAEHALALLKVECRPVRHPANGGATAFEAGIRQAVAELTRPS